jgi:hypothetical protein
MNNRKQEVKPKLLKRLRRAYAGLSRCKLLKLRDAYQLVDDSVRIPYEGFPMELMLGKKGKRLHLYPEYPLQDADRSARPPSFLVEDPEHAGECIGAFLRLDAGKELLLGRHDPQQERLFHYSNAVEKRHLRLVHDNDAVIFRDLSSTGTCISPILNQEKTERLSALRRVRKIFGGPVEPLPRAEAQDLIEQVIMVMKNEDLRPRDSRGMPGGLLELPGDVTPIVVADLHATVDNLLVILSHGDVLSALERGEACLVIIGDAVHSERDDTIEDMDDSILIMDLIFRLKLRFPKNVFFLRGNHESFSEEVSKAGVPQGLLWKRALVKARGKGYCRAMQDYYDLLPYVAVSPDFLATHAAPPRTKITKEMLVNMHSYPGLIPELINNRMQRPNRPGGYTKGDVRRFRNVLNLSPDVPFIVGHTPMDRTETCWLDVGRISNHHVLYSANARWVGAFVRIGGEMWPVRYPVESLRSLVNNLPPEKGDGESKKV